MSDELKIGAAAPGWFSGVPCERTDCQFEENGPCTTTLMGWKKVYNRQGLRIDDGDPNWASQEYYCLKCDKRWVRKSRNNEVAWSEAPKPTFPTMRTTNDRKFW